MRCVTPAAVFTHNLANYDTPWSRAEYGSDRAHPAEAALISAFFPPAPARVLDIGCGAGRSTKALAELGYSVVAIDLSAALLAIARDHCPALDFRAMDATKLLFEDGSFDAALFSYNGIDVIYPVAGRLACMAEAYRVLRSRGTFVLSTHNSIGAVCCGGVFYPRGLLNAAAFLGNQIRNRVAWEWYFRYTDGCGDHFLFSAPPAHTVRQLESVGFSVRAMCGDDAVRDLPLRHLTIRSQHVHFAAEKA